MGEKLETVICKVMGDNIYVAFFIYLKKICFPDFQFRSVGIGKMYQ